MDQGIVTPHDHDVLSGRGNFVNYHAGNEHFRALVRKHKVAYVACPKPQKGKFSRMIVDEIRSRNPPGRFLKQDAATKLWYDIGEKKALDKTRQALREGAPDIIKEMGGASDEDGFSDEHEGVRHNSSLDAFSHNRQQVIPPMRDNQGMPPEMHPGNLGGPHHQMHPGQYMQQPMSNHPYQQDNHHGNNMGRSMDPPPPMMRSNVGPSRQQQQQQQQQQPHMSVASVPGSQRIMRNPMGASSGVVPVRSLAGIRQAMQQQAQRNNAYLQQQHQQSSNGPHQHSGGMGGYGDMNNNNNNNNNNRGGMGGGGGGGVYPPNNMNNNSMPPMMGHFEPRPIGPGSGGAGGPVSIDNIHGDYESHENVGPLPGPMPQRYPSTSRRDMSREASDRSLNMDKVFGIQSSSHGARNMDNSAVSIMSLSIGDIVTKLVGEDSKAASTDLMDGDQLAPLFDSSVRLGPGGGDAEKRQKPGSSQSSGESKDFDKVMDMSVMSMGAELSGDGSTFRMAGSSAELSFSNVFDESDVNN